MTKLSLVIPTTGELNKIAEPKVDNALTAIQTWANGEIEGTNNLASEGVTEANLSSAVKTLLNTKSAFALSLVKKNETPFNIASGELVIMEKESSEVKLPAATLNRIVGVICASAITSVTIKAAVVNTIYGDFISAQTTITVPKNSHVILQADGTNWWIMAGEPKREQKYTSASFSKILWEAGIEFSATRNAFAIPGLLGTSVTIGGEAIGSEGNTGFFIPAGQKLKAKPAGAIEVSWLLL